MKVSGLTHLKEFTNDVIKQGKPFYKQVKRLTMYKDNKPMTWGQFQKLQ